MQLAGSVLESRINWPSVRLPLGRILMGGNMLSGRGLPWILAVAVIGIAGCGVAGCKYNEYQGPGKRWTQKREGRLREVRPDVWDRASMMAEYQVRFQDYNRQEVDLHELNRQIDVAVSNADQLKAYQLSKEREQADIKFCRSLIDLRLLRQRLTDSGVTQPGVRLLEIQPLRTVAEIRNNIEAYLKDDITKEVLIKRQDNFLYEEYRKRL